MNTQLASKALTLLILIVPISFLTLQMYKRVPETQEP